MRKPTSVDPLEMARFSQQAKEWWNIKGPYSMLLRMNPVRVGYIRNYLIGPNGTTSLPFKGLKMLDIGCGGGFLSQSLARLGAQVTAVDANLENIKVAQSYRGETNIQFIHGTAEELLEKKQDFDAVCGLEIVEHVVDPKKFIDTCSLLCKVTFSFI
jgi:2-polyprenyl-6-hydroxyphenyl methylase/3-demethylubiquinone-9 3-methyltransferase